MLKRFRLSICLGNNLYINAKSNLTEHNTTRKKPICGIQILIIGGVSLYAMGKTLLVQAYPWRTACMPRLSYPPVAYRPVRHG
jgi:hypothetical protein